MVGFEPRTSRSTDVGVNELATSTLAVSTGNLASIPKQKNSRNFKNPEKFWNSEKPETETRFQNFGKIDLIISPNRYNRSNRKKIAKSMRSIYWSTDQ